MAIPNSENGDSAAMVRGGRKRKRRDAAPEPGHRSFSTWRTESIEKRYSSKLLEALRRIRNDAAEPRGNGAVRDAADRALAVAARGRSRWSRAILSRRAIKLRAVRRRRQRGMGELPRSLPHPIERRRRRRRSELVQKKAEELGRLVPGCRKVSLPALLEETSDYIAALEMQIRAMSVIADAVSTAGGSSVGLPDRSGSPSTG
ncbi:transcription factor bHLH147-like [Ananas comosus]|uniref:Transcription factor bHLH147 n=2 Tax=Ananas comosus TaxID=4615 RepID=A0A199VKT2_ANACO|nr:transcription factor bHLH147-like [Ananas comosus]OAY77350.1 Transcription factor bHLH147 [Ananas comosus]CAD1828580.1 unnamed protein product [Ananas comosus var. bracteatus]